MPFSYIALASPEDQKEALNQLKNVQKPIKKVKKWKFNLQNNSGTK